MALIRAGTELEIVHWLNIVDQSSLMLAITLFFKLFLSARFFILGNGELKAIKL
jgi:hypothetical protein